MAISYSPLRGRKIIASPEVHEVRQGVPKIIETRVQTNVPAVGPSADSRTCPRIFAVAVVHTRSSHLAVPVTHKSRAAVGIPAPVASGCFPLTGTQEVAYDVVAAAADAVDGWEAVAVGRCFGEVKFGRQTRKPPLRSPNLLHLEVPSVSHGLPLPREERYQLESRTCLIWPAPTQCPNVATFGVYSLQHGSKRA